MSSNNVRDWLKDQTILITGSTGFIGNNLLLKLIDSKSSAKKIYVLVRNGKKMSASERIFELVHKEGYPTDKIQILPGDITSPNFGLDKNILDTISSEISVIYHLAASISFNLTLDKVVNINVRGTKSLLDFATRCRQLNVFVYCSTAYSQSKEPEALLEEKIYPAPEDPTKVLSMTKEELEKQTPQVLAEGWPNTYAWSKAVTEHLVGTYSRSFPIVVLRPSLVFPATQFPYSGWTLNQCLGTVICLLSKFRFNKFWKRSKYDFFNVVPVDIVTNAIIVASWYQANVRFIKNKENIYVVNLINYHKDYYNISFYVHDIGNLILVRSQFLFSTLAYLGEIIPLSPFSLYNANVKKIYLKLNYINNIASYYLNFKWNFESNNLKSLVNLSKKIQDKDIFGVEIDPNREKYHRLTLNSGETFYTKFKQENNYDTLTRIYTIWLYVYCLFVIIGLIYLFNFLL